MRFGMVLVCVLMGACAMAPATDSDTDADVGTDADAVADTDGDVEGDTMQALPCHDGETACYCDPSDTSVFWVRSCANGEFEPTEFNEMTPCPSGYRCVMASTRPDALVALCVEMPTPNMQCIR